MNECIFKPYKAFCGAFCCLCGLLCGFLHELLLHFLFCFRCDLCLRFRRRLRLMVAECSEEEAAALIPVIESVLSVIRSDRATQIK